MCLCVYGFAHRCVQVAFGNQKKASDLLELELQVWVLGIKPRASGRAVAVLSHLPQHPAPHCLLFIAKVVLTKACTCDSVLPAVISVQKPETFADSPSPELSQFSPMSESHRMGLCEKLMF